MRTFHNTVYNFCLRSVQILTLALTGLLFLSGFLSTAYSLDMDSQDVLITWDNPLLTGIGSLLICLLFWCLTTLIRKGTVATLKSFRFLILCWCMFVSAILIVFSKSGPSGDAYSVYSIAENLALGNTAVIHPTDSYISYYPQQIGLVAFWEIIIRIVHLLPVDLPAYHFIKLLYGALVCAIVFFQERTVHTLWRNEKADCLYLLLAGANCPLLMYTSFVYGEIPSYAALTVGIYLLTCLLTDRSRNIPAHPILHSAGCVIFFALSVMLRKNSLIFLIAVVIVILVQGLYQKRYTLFALAGICILCAVTILPLTERYYEHRSGNSISSGVTATSYFAMGMQEAPRAKGWYNGFNFNTYRDSGMDSALANEISKNAIRERLEYFKENPDYAASFYLEKYLSQWVDGSYACRQATLATFGGRNAFFQSLYEGEYSKYFIAYCNAYQNLLYLGAFLFCLTGLKSTSNSASANMGAGKKQELTNPAKKDPVGEAFSLPTYLGLIAVLGGFLFHMIWEANSRYIVTYGFTLLPYAAQGLTQLTDRLTLLLHTRTKAGKTSA